MLLLLRNSVLICENVCTEELCNFPPSDLIFSNFILSGINWPRISVGGLLRSRCVVLRKSPEEKFSTRSEVFSISKSSEHC